MGRGEQAESHEVSWGFIPSVGVMWVNRAFKPLCAREHRLWGPPRRKQGWVRSQHRAQPALMDDLLEARSERKFTAP